MYQAVMSSYGEDDTEPRGTLGNKASSERSTWSNQTSAILGWNYGTHTPPWHTEHMSAPTLFTYQHHTKHPHTLPYTHIHTDTHTHQLVK